MKVSIQGKKGLMVIDLNRRKAIRQRCLNCTGWAVKAVTTCDFAECPLHNLRSGKGKQNAKTRAKAIMSYCLWCMNGQRVEVSRCVSKDCSLFPYRNSDIDKSINIPVLQKKHHIGAVLGDNSERAYMYEHEKV